MHLWLAWKVIGTMVGGFRILRATAKAYQAIKNLRTKTKARHRKG